MKTKAEDGLIDGVDEDDMYRLRDLMIEFAGAGRMDDAHLMARLHAIVTGILYPYEVEEAEADEEFVRSFEQAERDIAEGRLIPHEEVMRRLGTLDHVRD